MGRRAHRIETWASSTLLLGSVIGSTPGCVDTTGTSSDASVASAPKPNPELTDGGVGATTPPTSLDTTPSSTASSSTPAFVSDDPAQTGANFGLPVFGAGRDGGTPALDLTTTTAGDSSASTQDIAESSGPASSASITESSVSPPSNDTDGTSATDVSACGPCPDTGDPCVTAVCNPASGACEPVPNDGAACDDGDACTTLDACDGAGTCRGADRDCSHLDDQCLTGTCNATSGECEALPAHEQDNCSDDDPCTLDDVCNALGECVGSPKSCAQYDQACVRGVCNTESGVCEPANLENGSACDDLSPCTTNDVCREGQCGGVTPDKCDSGGALDLTGGSVSVALDTSCIGVANDFDVATYIPTGDRPPTAGDCDQSLGRDAFLLLDLSDYTGLVRLQASTDQPSTLFDTVLILMGAEPNSDRQCGYTTLTACSDDLSNDKKQSRIDVTVAPGVYALVVDGYIESKKGPVGLSVTLQELATTPGQTVPPQ